MAKRKRQRRKRRKSGRGALVKAYAEGLSGSVLDDKYREHFKAVVGRRKSGIYILSKGKRIYYIGLAGNLPSRLKKHLKDRHSGKWDSFSLYSIGKKRFVKDVETVLIRVLRPKGNKVKGSFGRKRGLNKKIRKEILNAVAKEILPS